MQKDPNKGYIALLGWAPNAVEAAENFDRRYVVVAPEWAEEYCENHKIPYVPWNFERLNDRSMEIAQTLKDMGVDVAIPLPCSSLTAIPTTRFISRPLTRQAALVTGLSARRMRLTVFPTRNFWP